MNIAHTYIAEVYPLDLSVKYFSNAGTDRQHVVNISSVCNVESIIAVAGLVTRRRRRMSLVLLYLADFQFLFGSLFHTHIFVFSDLVSHIYISDICNL